MSHSSHGACNHYYSKGEHHHLPHGADRNIQIFPINALPLHRPALDSYLSIHSWDHTSNCSQFSFGSLSSCLSTNCPGGWGVQRQGEVSKSLLIPDRKLQTDWSNNISKLQLGEPMNFGRLISGVLVRHNLYGQRCFKENHVTKIPHHMWKLITARTLEFSTLLTDCSSQRVSCLWQSLLLIQLVEKGALQV